MIKFVNVYKKYSRDFYCLYNANFSFSQSTLIIGDDYVGSSGILRLISKIDKPDNGEIFIDDININAIKDKNLNLAYIPSEPIFYNNNLFDNLYFPLKIRKINKKLAKNIINNELIQYKIQNLNKKIKNLSLTEKKIITLLRAKIRQPKYILIENFMENIDEKYIDIILQLLTDMSKYCTIIATEKTEYEIYKNLKFNIIKLYKNN